MLGLYDRTPKRAKVTLDGWWELCIDREELCETPADLDRLQARRAWVPGCWNTELDLQDYQGVAWYRRLFECDFPGQARLVLGAVADLAQVWLDDQYLGEHEGGFTAFEFVTSVQAGIHELVVRVDNRHSETTLPKEGVDWFPYGGITRSVICEQVGAAFVRNVHVRGDLQGQVEAQVYVQNLDQAPVTLPLSLSIDGVLCVEETVTIAGGECQVETLRARIAGPRLWSPEQPNMYTATVRLAEDEHQARFGLREIRVRGVDILLNGEKIWIRGVNRHEDHPDWGFALPPKLMGRDIDIIRGLNCNAVRGSHYPNHPTFLDMCDEAGLLFFAEIPAWQYSAAQLATSPTYDKMAQTLREMVDQQHNHPCIFTWCLHNECRTDAEDEGDVDLTAATSKLFALARSLDDTRPVTFASDKYWRDRQLHQADVICLNEYIGWYVDELDGADFEAYLRRMAERHPDKPILITEFGAGGIPGYHSMPGLKWSEEYQAQHLKRSIETMLENDHVSGCFVWQYCDIMVHPSRALRRPRSLNNKGLVDEYRRPKLGYWIVKELYAKIAGRTD
ncbi:MAG: beta-galactosidase [Anaerolineae bacterium]|nr:beta-galactosidase [Anaerolineae bacterium]